MSIRSLVHHIFDLVWPTLHIINPCKWCWNMELGGKQRRWHGTHVVIWQVMKATLINMAHKIKYINVVNHKFGAFLNWQEKKNQDVPYISLVLMCNNTKTNGLRGNHPTISSPRAKQEGETWPQFTLDTNTKSKRNLKHTWIRIDSETTIEPCHYQKRKKERRKN